MHIGVCLNCRQSAEIHEGIDGKGYCEDCLVALGKDRESARIREKVRNEGARELSDSSKKERFQEQNSNKQAYLNYIITNATSKFINSFLRKYIKTLKDTYGWINILQNESNEMVLLRLAAELGYGNDKKLEERNTERNTERDGEDKQSGNKKKGGRRIKASND